MAKLHRRVRGFSDLGVRAQARGALAGLVGLLLHANAASALDRDTAPAAAEIATLAKSLGASDAQARAHAFTTLRSLGEDALPGIDQRLTQLASQLDSAGTADALTEFRRVQGVDAPNADVDLEKGVLPTLAAHRTRGVLQAAELIALLRALEAQQTPRAAELAIDGLIGLDPKLFRFEAPRTIARFGVVALPALVRALAHPRPQLRELATDTLVAQHLDTPGRAVQQDDVTLLAALLEAYGDTLTFDAMPVICSYLTDERVAVAEAAQRAIRRFRKNAIWQLREVYRNATGADAPLSFGTERLLTEIVNLHRGPKLAVAKQAIAEAQNALARTDLDATAIALDKALTTEPHGEPATAAAPLYAELGERYLNAGAPGAALGALRRARRLHKEQGPALSARIEYLEAEARRQQGLLDVAGFDRALTLDPTLSQAAEARDEASGAKAANARRIRHLSGLMAAVMLLLAGVWLLRAGKTNPVAESD